MKKLSLVLSVALFWAAAPLFSDNSDGTSGLFDNPPQDIIADTNQKVDLNQLVVKSNKYFWNIEADAAYAGGVKKGDPDYNQSLYYLLHLVGGIDARPIPQVRVYGSLSTLLPQGLDPNTATSLVQGNQATQVYPPTKALLNTASIISLNEIWIDYTIGDFAFIKTGNYSLTWGQGRIYNPGNLTNGIGDGVTLKAFIPALGNGITGLVIGRPSYFSNSGNPNIYEFGYAGAFETTVGPLSMGISGFHQEATSNTEDLYVKTTFFGVDLYAEGLVSQTPGDDAYPSLLTGLFWEFGELKWKLTAEFWLDGSLGDYNDQKIGLGISADPLPVIGVKPSLRWLHSLEDGSGQVIIGLDSNPLPDMTISLGIPFVYGSDSGYFVVNNSDPQKRWIAPLVRASINVAF